MTPTEIDAYVDDLMDQITDDMIDESHRFTFNQQERMREVITDILLESAD